jgi:hypothetical protein
MWRASDRFESALLEDRREPFLDYGGGLRERLLRHRLLGAGACRGALRRFRVVFERASAKLVDRSPERFAAQARLRRDPFEVSGIEPRILCQDGGWRGRVLAIQFRGASENGAGLVGIKRGPCFGRQINLRPQG